MKTKIKFLDNSPYISLNDLVDFFMTQSSLERPPTCKEITLYLAKISVEAWEKYNG